MSRLLGRFRLLLPPTSFFLAYILLYLGANVPILFWRLDAPFQPPPPDFSKMRRGILLFGLVAYGFYRLIAFHPFDRAGYRKWLESTPWTWRKPLPVGPVRPVLEDALLISAMSAPAWYFGDFDPLATFCLPLGAYLTMLSFTFPGTGARGFNFATLFAVGAAIRVWDGPAWGYTSAILVAWAFGATGLTRSLKNWPWKAGVVAVDPNHLETFAGQTPTSTPILGWPYDRLGPRKDVPLDFQKTLDRFFGCLLTAWWFYALLALAPEAGRIPIATMVLVNGSVVGSIIRISQYATGYAPPISLAARLVRFKPIIPSYDQIFVAPLAAIFAANAGPWMLIRTGLPFDAAASISFALALIALFLGGPDRLRWQLTSKNRVVPAIGNASKTQGGFIQVG